jgi:hypothetical protein
MALRSNYSIREKLHYALVVLMAILAVTAGLVSSLKLRGVQNDGLMKVATVAATLMGETAGACASVSAVTDFWLWSSTPNT